MANPKVMTGAIALIKCKGVVIGKMRTVRVQENATRVPVRGIGTILATEQAVVSYDLSLSCDFMEVNFQTTGIPDAIRRKFANAASQVQTGNVSFEDQLVLDTDGVQVDIFKKVTDVVNPDGTIKPKLEPYATIKDALIESDSFDISEGAISGHSQSFKYLTPILYTP